MHSLSGWSLDPARVRRWAGIGLAFQLIMGAVLVAGTHGWLMALPKASTTDFVSFYAAGTVAAQPGPVRVYDRAAHYAAERAATAPGIAYVYFFYPPVFLLYCRLLAAFPYLAAFLCFEALGLVAWLFVLRRILGPAPAWWYLPFLSFSPVLWNIGFGQNALMTAAMFGAGLYLLHGRRDLAAGLALGLLFYKPHTGLLIPIALISARNWRAVAGATISVVGSVLLSVLAFGVPAWRAFFVAIMGSRGEYGAGAITPFATTVNVIGMLRDHGIGLHAATLAQLVVQIAVAGAVIWCWRSPHDENDAGRIVVLIAGALLVMPVVLFYDLTLLTIAAAVIVREARRTGFLAGEKACLAAIWLAGLWCYPLARVAHLPLGQFAVGAMILLGLRRHRQFCYRLLNFSPVASAQLRPPVAHGAGQDDKMTIGPF